MCPLTTSRRVVSLNLSAKNHTPWTAADLPSLAGRTVVVTGAASGLGAVTAKELARVGARVVLAVRDPARGERLAATLTGSTEVRPLDLADLSSVRAFARAWDRPLDVLVNNAGVMAIPEARCGTSPSSSPRSASPRRRRATETGEGAR